MTIPDWLSPEQQGYVASMDAAQWAGEYLRRSVDYHVDWQGFNESRSALEVEYSAPPLRDFFRWNQDPLAYRGDDDGEPPLFECWMGDRWGLYKTPPNPAVSAPALRTGLRWRLQESVVPPVRRSVGACGD